MTRGGLTHRNTEYGYFKVGAGLLALQPGKARRPTDQSEIMGLLLAWIVSLWRGRQLLPWPCAPSVVPACTLPAARPPAVRLRALRLASIHAPPHRLRTH